MKETKPNATARSARRSGEDGIRRERKLHLLANRPSDAEAGVENRTSIFEKADCLTGKFVAGNTLKPPDWIWASNPFVSFLSPFFISGLC